MRNLILPLRTDKSGFLNIWSIGVKYMPGKYVRVLNRNAMIAALLGAVLLMVSYFGVPENSFWHNLTHEIGFALLVAVTIWVTFEFFNQVESDEHWNARIESIAKNVFFGVFKRNFPPEFIKEANILVLEHQFIRYGMHVTYTLEDRTYPDRSGLQRNFVKLSAVLRYKMRNIGNSPTDCAVAIGLPNPLIDEMKSECKVNSITVKQGGNEEKRDLAEAEAEFRKQLHDDNVYNVKFKVKPVTVKPEETIEIIMDYSMAKEEEDTEIFSTLCPADSVTVVIMDRGPTRRLVRARSIHLSPLENDTSAERQGVYNFKLDRYLLPHQGFAIWWKKVPLEQLKDLNVSA